MTDQTTPDPRVEATIHQLAMYQQRLDAVEHGMVQDGVAHPTWDELGPVDGQQQYLTDARRMVEVMRVLGWALRETLTTETWSKASPVFESTGAAYAWLADEARRVAPKTPSTDDREALLQAMRGSQPKWSSIVFYEEAADAVLAAGFRLPSPPTEEQVEAAYRSYEGIQPYLFVHGPHTDRGRQKMRAALEAAARVGGEAE